jgi:hypothetical protein
MLRRAVWWRTTSIPHTKVAATKDVRLHAVRRRISVRGTARTSTSTAFFCVACVAFLTTVKYLLSSINWKPVKMFSEATTDSVLECICTFSFPGFSKLGTAQGLTYTSAMTTMGELTFGVEMYPGGDVNAAAGNVSLGVSAISIKPLLFKFTLDLMAGETVAKTYTADQHSTVPKKNWGWTNFALRSYILDPANRVLNADCLMIRVKMTIEPSCPPPGTAKPTCAETSDRYAYRAGPDTAQADLLAQHEVESGSHDFAIVVKAPVTVKKEAGEPLLAQDRIPAHKLILTARSPVFRAMLSSGMQEASAVEMEITGYAAEAVRAFVRFLYCDDCTKLSLQDHAWDLLALTDKYDIAGLRFTCEMYQAKQLQEANALSTLLRADTHNAPVLKRKALEYIAQNKKVVSENPAVLEGLSNELLREVVCMLAK